MKKHLKNFISIFLVIITLLSSSAIGLSNFDFSDLFLISAKAYEYKEGYYTYEISDKNEAIITDVDESISGDITIPSTLGGYPVTGIDDYAFLGRKSLSSVIIPDSITSVGLSTFESCANLKSVTIGKGISRIGHHMFRECTSLTSITIPSNVKYIGYWAFYHCSKLETVTFANGLETIYEGAFGECVNLKNVILPNSLYYVGIFAFGNCSGMESITIPKNIKTIDYSAFSHCNNLVDVYYTGNLTEWCNIDFRDSSSNPKFFAKNLYINGKQIEGDVVIPSGVITISANFAGFSSITSITIPDSVTTIQDQAFYNCSNLESVTIPKYITYIGSNVFYCCDNLTDIYFTGTEEEWNAITIDSYNEDLFNANIHFAYHKAIWNVDNKKTVNTVTVGDKVVPPADPVKFGYTFLGWSPAVPKNMPEYDIEFTAIWAANGYNAAFNANGGMWNNGETTKTVFTYFDAPITAPEAPQKPGYIFNGWSPEVGNMTNDGMSFSAIWKAKNDTPYIIEMYEMNINGEYIKFSHQCTGTTDSAADAYEYAYKLENGFVLNEEKSVLIGNISADGSLVLKVYIDRKKYALTIDINGKKETKEYLYGSQIEKPTDPQIEGYIFEGWSPEFPELMPSKDVLCVAILSEYDCKIFIKNNMNLATINYGDTLRLSVETSNLPVGAYVKWSAEGTGVSIHQNTKGTVCDVLATNQGEVVVTAKIVDGNGNALKSAFGNEFSDSQTVRINGGFWWKIVSFFKNLFGISRTVVQNVYKV